MKKILIIGAGVAGSDVIREVVSSPEMKIKVVGFVDDDKSKRYKVIEGIKVLGDSRDIQNIIKRKGVNEIIIAIPSALGEDIDRLVKMAVESKIAYRIVPRVKEIIEGRASLSSVRKVEIQDLLGRPVIKAEVSELRDFFRNKTVLVTGAAGSIGSELSSQIAAYNPKRIVLFDVWENGVFELKQKLDDQGFNKGIEYVIGNIQDVNRLNNVFSFYKPNYVFHAAAYKHVPLMEENPIEALKNNVIGTYNVSHAAIRNNVERFVLVSTDKAADPKNIMGLTKRFVEIIAASFGTSTKFITVRFGNVLGSNGSVVPIFRKQIEAGGPVKVTDKRMTRYFMTIPEAVGLILKSSRIGNGGELFVLDMGKPMSILTLAQKMIRLSGFVPNKDIKIIFTGIRKGEKLSEKLFTKIEKLDKTEDGKIFVSKIDKKFKDIESVISKVNGLINEGDERNIKTRITKIINDKQN